jgi:hypothetical protein
MRYDTMRIHKYEHTVACITTMYVRSQSVKCLIGYVYMWNIMFHARRPHKHTYMWHTHTYVLDKYVIYLVCLALRADHAHKHQDPVGCNEAGGK